MNRNLSFLMKLISAKFYQNPRSKGGNNPIEWYGIRTSSMPNHPFNHSLATGGMPSAITFTAMQSRRTVQLLRLLE